MAKKPVIVYIESAYNGFSDDNPYRDALSYFLREHCGCEVVLYDSDYSLKEERKRLKDLVECGEVILWIVAQERHSDQYKKTVRKIRGAFSRTLPIVLLPSGYGDDCTADPADASLTIFEHTDVGLIELVHRLAREWSPQPNWFGVEDVEDQARLADQLRHVYCRHTLENVDGAFGTPDENHQLIAEALRMRLLPPSLIKAEFEDALESEPRAFISAQASVYDAELEKVRTMTDDERTRFYHKLLRAKGCEPAEGGGLYVMRSWSGGDVNGFAIDPVTLETLTTHRFGEHHLAKDMLARRIEVIEALRHRKKFFELSVESARKCNWRLLSGLIFLKIDGFTVPILCLSTDCEDENDMKKVVSFLQRERMFIPVTFDGHLL